MLAYLLTAALTCPGYTGHLTISEYEGPVAMEYCVSALQIAAPDVHITLYDPTTEGIFHNGFD